MIRLRSPAVIVIPRLSETIIPGLSSTKQYLSWHHVFLFFFISDTYSVQPLIKQTKLTKWAQQGE